MPAIAFLLQRLRKLTHLSLTGVPSFRRAELQSFCRSPPKDFNAHQRQAFCVYSGIGVAQLREHLANVLAQAAGLNHQNMAGHDGGFGQFNGFSGQPAIGPGRRFPRFAMAAAGFGQFLVGPHQQPGPGPNFFPHLHPHLPWSSLTAEQLAQLPPQELSARHASIAAAQADMDEDDMVDEDEDDEDDNETVAAHPQYYQYAQLAHPQPFAPVTAGPNALATLAAAAAAATPQVNTDGGGGNRWWQGQALAGPSSAPAASGSGWPNVPMVPPQAPSIASSSQMPPVVGAVDGAEAADGMEEDSGDDENMDVDARR